MPTIAVLPSQKNEILHAIQAEGLDPTNFEWHKRFREGNQRETEEVLKYKN